MVSCNPVFIASLSCFHRKFSISGQDLKLDEKPLRAYYNIGNGSIIRVEMKIKGGASIESKSSETDSRDDEMEVKCCGLRKDNKKKKGKLSFETFRVQT